MSTQSIDWWRQRILAKCPSIYAFHLSLSPSLLAQNNDYLNINDTSTAFIVNGELILELAQAKDIPAFLKHFEAKTKTIFVQDKELTGIVRKLQSDFTESSFIRSCYEADLKLWQEDNYPKRIVRNIKKSKQHITDIIWRNATFADLEQFWVEYKLYALDMRFKIPSRKIVEHLWNDWGIFNELSFFEIKFDDENQAKWRKQIYFHSNDFATYLFGWGDKHSKTSLDAFMFDYAANKFKAKNITRLDLGLLPERNEGISSFKTSFPGSKKQHILTTFKKYT